MTDIVLRNGVPACERIWQFSEHNWKCCHSPYFNALALLRGAMRQPTWHAEPPVDASAATLAIVRATARRLLIDRNGLFCRDLFHRDASYNEMFDERSVESIIRLMRWLRTRVYPTIDSYRLKRLCEDATTRYVYNGELIIAAVLCGISVNMDPSAAARAGSHPHRSAVIKGAPEHECALTRMISDALQEERSVSLRTTNKARDRCSKLEGSPSQACRAIVDAFLVEGKPRRVHRALFHLWPKAAKDAVRTFIKVLHRKEVPRELVDKIVENVTL